METKIFFYSTASKRRLSSKMRVVRYLLTALSAVGFICSVAAQEQPPLLAAAAQLTNEGYSFVPVANPPEFGTFWSMQLTNWPPLPANPFPTLEVFAWQADGSTNGGNEFYYDDLNIDYGPAGPIFSGLAPGKTNRWDGPERRAAGPPSPGDGDDSTNNPGDGGVAPHFSPPASMPTNYLTEANDFWLSIQQQGTNAVVSLNGTLSNLTYEIWTNGSLTGGSWGLWQILVASNSITMAPPIDLSSNALFFVGDLVSDTGSSGLPDNWQMAYFGQLNVDPYDDPDGDGLCTLDEFMLGTNPTNAYSISSLHTDAQALFLAYTNDPACYYQLAITFSDSNTLQVTMWPTGIGTNYQIYSKDLSVSHSAWRVEQSFVGTGGSTTVTISINGRDLSLIGGYAEDDDGDELPTGYEVLATLTDPFLPDTGLTGTPDGYKDPDGDGYVNLAEYQNGTDPHVFDLPIGALNLTVDFTSNTNSLSLAWQPAGGAVSQYVITVGSTVIATVDANTLGYTVTNASIYGYTAGSCIFPFTIAAVYTNGESVETSGGIPAHPVVAGLAEAHGPGGNTYLLASAASSNIVDYTNLEPYQISYGYPLGAAYGQTVQSYTPLPSPVDVPAAQFTNGVAVLDSAQAPPYADTSLVNVPYQWSCPVLNNSAIGNFVNAGETPSLAVPFIDGSKVMKQNVRFLLRAAANSPFAYTLSLSLDSFGFASTWQYPGNYVYSSIYDSAGGAVFDNFAPFQDNYFYANFIFNSVLIDSDGNMEMGFWPFDQNSYYYSLADAYNQYTNAAIEFPTFDYVTISNGAPIPGLLSSNQATYVGYFQSDMTDFGAYTSGGALGMSATATNCYGLQYNSLQLTMSNHSGIYFDTLSPGHNVTGYTGGPFYADTVQPDLQTVDYYFAQPGINPLPGSSDGSFAVTNTTPLILGAAGTPMLIAGYAKQALLNGAPDVFTYLGQYFTNAFLMTNGTATTNSAGILSEYGEFFPTTPGQIRLQTKPDPDQTNIQGTCEVDIIRLSLDVNHDGVMDESFTGPDNTSQSMPFIFWANNDYDRWDIDSIDSLATGTNYDEEDDLSSTSIAVQNSSGLPVADCDYKDASGHRVIPCPRDLEDFARLWVSGVSNTLSRLPAGSAVTLSWATNYDEFGNPTFLGIPTIDLFRAADADGGIGYMTNLTTASNQINTNLCPHLGYLFPGEPIVLNSSAFSNGWAGDHFIWCGEQPGSGQLLLTISDGDGNLLAQSSQYVQIVDVKQMYERWTVGDTPGDAPQSIAVRADDGLQAAGMTAPFVYPYDPAVDTNDTYILSVHGYNIPLWEAERFSETAYKRMYWQGYTGRFGSFRWPAHSNPLLFDDDELSSWESGTGLYHLLYSLNAKYPGKVYLFAHSQGNIAAGQALLMAGTNIVVNTYIAAQGAVAAHAYDPTTANRTPTPGTSFTTPDCYAQYWTNGRPPYFNSVTGAGRYINFFNTNDWALTLPWPVTQDTKPDANWKTLSLFQRYDYDGSNFLYETTDPNPPLFTVRSATVLAFPTNTFSIFAFCDQAPCMALGAQNNVAGVFQFGPTYRQVELDVPPYNFGKLHVYHSGEFRSDNMQRWPFWNQVLQSYGLK